jgi:hypothetical protein
MAVPTQALQLAEEEAVPVAAVRLNVIGDRGGDDMSMLAADPAQRLEPELMLRPLAPALEEYHSRHGRVDAGSSARGGMPLRMASDRAPRQFLELRAADAPSTPWMVGKAMPLATLELALNVMERSLP